MENRPEYGHSSQNAALRGIVNAHVEAFRIARKAIAHHEDARLRQWLPSIEQAIAEGGRIADELAAGDDL